MSANKFNSKEQDRIDEEAAEWFIKRDRGLSACELDGYRQWLKADARHRTRIQWHEKTWQRFSPIEEFDKNEDFGEKSTGPDVTRISHRFRRYAMAIGSFAAVLLIGLSFGGAMWFLNSGDDVEFEGRYVVNAYENRILPDGTILELNEGVRVKVQFTKIRRSVWLHQGEAYFRIAKELDRPFTVFAGSTNVRAVGTEFNVRFNREQVQVAVTEGRVNLSKAASVEPKKSQTPLFSREMDAGQVSTISMIANSAPPVIETVTYDRLSELLAWKPETLEFRSAPLGDVVMAFNKRNEIQIILADDELETMPVEATFRSDNVLAFARLLEVTFELRAERRSPNEIVLSLPH